MATVSSRIAVAIALLVIVFARDVHPASATGQTIRDAYTARLIGQLEQIDPHLYDDLHGNAHEHLQALMIAKEDATPELMRAIDRLSRDTRREPLVRALYHVLGFVKDPLRALIRVDERAAAACFEKVKYRWDDIALLPFVDRELSHRPSFRNHIAGWINLTYQPAYRARLEPIARTLAPQAASLAPWARDLLVDRDFLAGRRKGTWTDYVRMWNSVV